MVAAAEAAILSRTETKPSKMLQLITVLLSVRLALGSATIAKSVEELDSIVQIQPYALVVLSKGKNCPSCERYEKVLQDNLKEIEDLYQCSLTIVRDSGDVQKRYGVEQIPRVMFFREGIPAIYHSPELLPSDLLFWIHKARDSRVQILDDTVFERMTQATSGATTGDWLVAFVATKTPALRAKLEGLQAVFAGYATSVAIVDYTQNVNLKKRFAITQDTILFFRQNKMYRFIGSKWEAKALIDFVAQTFRHVKAEKIPLESSMFDYVLDTSVRLVRANVEPLAKQYMADLKQHRFSLIICTVMFIAVVLILFVVRREKKKVKSS